MLRRTFIKKLKNTKNKTFFSLPVKFKSISLNEKKDPMKKVKVKILTIVYASKYSTVKKKTYKIFKK